MMTKELPTAGDAVGTSGNCKGAADVSKGKYTPKRHKTQAAHNTMVAMAELQRLPQWVAWKWVDDPDGKKPRKMPVNPRTGGNASTKRPASWGTYQQAVDRATRDDLAGIGFVFTADDPYCGVDLDNCIDDRGNVKPWADGYAHKLNSYTEVSQSGKGLHVIVKATLPEGRGRKAQQVEVYDRGRFFVWTGAHVPDSPTVLHERQDLINDLLREHFGVKAKDPATPRYDPQPVNLDDHKLLELARNAANGAKFSRLWSGNWNGYGSQSEADLALTAYLAFWTGGDAQRMNALFQQSGLYRPGKWNEQHAHDGRTYGKMTIDKALEGLKTSFDPAGSGTRCDSSNQETAPDPKEWELTSDDLRECPHCAAWWHRMDEKLIFYHKYCGNKTCPVYGKIRLRRMLSAALDWQTVYLTEIDDRDYRTVRDMIDGGYIAAPQPDNRVVIATERPTPYSVSIRTETALEAMGTALAAIPDGKRVRRRQVKRERPTTPAQRRDPLFDGRLRPGELKIVLAALDVFGIAYRQYRATFQTVEELTVEQKAQVKSVFDYLAKQPWGTSSLDTVLEHTGTPGLTVSTDEEWPEPLPYTMREYRLDAVRRRYTTKVEVPKSP